MVFFYPSRSSEASKFLKGEKGMIVKDVRFQLKDGREALLRSPKEEDVESTLEYLFISAGETDYLLRYPECCPAN